MARVSHDKAMKDMVIRVKELCGDVDDNAIQILLQQYDFNVDQTVQAFLDGSAEETLREWKSLGGGAKTSVSKKKKRNKNRNSAQNHESANGSPSVQNVNHVASDVSDLCNGGVSPDAASINGAFLSEAEHIEPQESRVVLSNQTSHKHSPPQSRPKEDYKQQTKKARDRTVSEASTSSGIDKPYKNPHAGLEKSLKDLQRQTVSLQRLKVVLNEQVDKSFKRISEVFKELHNQLNEREAQLIFTMDKVKTQANDVLEEQQLKALQLKHQTDRAQVMKDSEVAELRSRIKSFVSERKHYEDLSHAQRFVCDFNQILEQLKNFGEVIPVKTAPDHRRASVASVGSSSTGHEETSSPSKPSSAATPLPSQTISRQSSAPVPVVAAAPSTSASVPTVFVPNSAHVLMQSDSLTKYEATEMAQRLANLALSDSKVSTSSTFESPRTDRGRGSRGRGSRGRGSRGRGSGITGVDADRSAKSSLGDQQRDIQSARGQGRGGRGQGRSSRGRGESGDTNESSANDDQRSNKSKDRNARSDVDSVKEHDQDSSSATPGRQAQASKSPGNSPRRGGRRGRRQDNRGERASGDSSKSDADTKPAHEPTINHDGSHGDAGKSTSSNNNNNDDVLPSLNKPASDDLTNDQVDALPQRGTRASRRGGGGRHRAENQPMETLEPVLANGE